MTVCVTRLGKAHRRRIAAKERRTLEVQMMVVQCMNCGQAYDWRSWHNCPRFQWLRNRLGAIATAEDLQFGSNPTDAQLSTFPTA